MCVWGGGWAFTNNNNNNENNNSNNNCNNNNKMIFNPTCTCIADLRLTYPGNAGIQKRSKPLAAMIQSQGTHDTHGLSLVMALGPTSTSRPYL